MLPLSIDIYQFFRICWSQALHQWESIIISAPQLWVGLSPLPGHLLRYLLHGNRCLSLPAGQIASAASRFTAICLLALCPAAKYLKLNCPKPNLLLSPHSAHPVFILWLRKNTAIHSPIQGSFFLSPSYSSPSPVNSTSSLKGFFSLPSTAKIKLPYFWTLSSLSWTVFHGLPVPSPSTAIYSVKKTARSSNLTIIITQEKWKYTLKKQICTRMFMALWSVKSKN